MYVLGGKGRFSATTCVVRCSNFEILTKAYRLRSSVHAPKVVVYGIVGNGIEPSGKVEICQVEFGNALPSL